MFVSERFLCLFPQNGRDPMRKPTDRKSQEMDEILKEVLNTIPAAPLDGIGATPRNNEMEKKFNLSDMHLPSKHKVGYPVYLDWIFFNISSLYYPSVSHSTWSNVTA